MTVPFPCVGYKCCTEPYVCVCMLQGMLQAEGKEEQKLVLKIVMG